MMIKGGKILLIVAVVALLFGAGFVFLRRNKTAAETVVKENFIYRQYFLLIQARIDYMEITKVSSRNDNLHERLPSLINTAIAENNNAKAEFEAPESIDSDNDFFVDQEEVVVLLTKQGEILQEVKQKLGDVVEILSFYSQNESEEKLTEDKEMWIESAAITLNKIAEISLAIDSQDNSQESVLRGLKDELNDLRKLIEEFDEYLKNGEFAQAKVILDEITESVYMVKYDAIEYIVSPLLTSDSLATMKGITDTIYAYEFNLKGRWGE